MPLTCVITVDVKGSRKLAFHERELIQTKVLNTVDYLEQNLETTVVTAGMTAGDEFQVVLYNIQNFFTIYRFLQNSLNVNLYYGVGVGQIQAVKDGLRPSEMYGTAFYLSRDALNEAKKKEVNIVFKTNDQSFDFTLNVLIGLVYFIRKNWTKRQKEILRFVEQQSDHQGKIKQKDVAKHFNVSEQYISKIFKKTGFELIQQAEFRVTSLLAKLQNNNDLYNKPK